MYISKRPKTDHDSIDSILWPLLHYHPSEIVFDEDAFIAYKEANSQFADTIIRETTDGDLIWVHDYHLMLLPQILREKFKEQGKQNIRIGFFLHTPFPSSEIYRILPVRDSLLRGVLSCDLIGFHTYDYVRHFLNSCSLLLWVFHFSMDHWMLTFSFVQFCCFSLVYVIYANDSYSPDLITTPTGVRFEGRNVTIGAFPIGIDLENFKKGFQKPKVQRRIASLEKEFRGKKLMVGVDRLDYIKGLPQKLHALEVFLSNHHEWVGKVVLVQVAVPSRQDVEEYQNLRELVNELVGRINGKFGK